MTTLYIDIETSNVPGRVIESKMADWLPPANYKTEKAIESAKLKRFEAIADKAALFNESPIICVGYAVDDEPPHVIVSTAGAPNQEFTVLKRLIDMLPPHIITLVGHNILGFDLPKLRGAYLRHGMAVPLPFRWAVPQHIDIIDTMAVACRHFNCEPDYARVMSLMGACRLVGIATPDDTIPGKDVPKLYNKGDMEAIAGHCIQDIQLTRALYQRMIGLALPPISQDYGPYDPTLDIEA